uniref:C-type lectin domain-containing protein n=1 Tax=Laticauda laticaudata TaxID=8630 RepID=A0A8C5SBF0_LATLA
GWSWSWWVCPTRTSKRAMFLPSPESGGFPQASGTLNPTPDYIPLPSFMSYCRNCYGLFHEKLSWHEAEIRCQSYGRGTHLASILTWPETLIVSKHISAYMKEKGVDVWIGLHDVRHVSMILQISLLITSPPLLTSV